MFIAAIHGRSRAPAERDVVPRRCHYDDRFTSSRFDTLHSAGVRSLMLLETINMPLLWSEERSFDQLELIYEMGQVQAQSTKLEDLLTTKFSLPLLNISFQPFFGIFGLEELLLKFTFER